MCAASAGVGPNADCSRKRRAADADTCGFCTPIETANGCETTGPFATVRLPELAGPAKPEIVSDEVLPKVVVSAMPFRLATEAAVKPVPVTVVEKIPSGSGDVPSDEMVGATLLTRVTVAALFPVEFEAVTVSIPAAGIAAGAV